MRAELFPFQKKAVKELLDGKCIVVSTMGSGKSAMMFNWLYNVKAKKVLVITTSSKAKSGDMFTEADKFNGEDWLPSLDEYDVVSWDMLYKWKDAHADTDLSDWYIAADEIAKAKSGVSSKRGKAFLYLADKCKAWTGYTGTPGDTWMDFYAYFQATGKVKNKTDFMRRFCEINTFFGYPKIEGYRDEDILHNWWAEISTAPDTSQMERELPKQTHNVVHFAKPRGYDKVIKTCHRLKPNEEGETFIESNSELLHYLRQLCNTQDKQKWIEDYIDSLNEPVVVFYNYNCEFDTICEAAKKAGRKVWRINGKFHEIPTEQTIGKDDVIIAHYMSGGEALNLQFCRYMVMYSYNYSYSTSVQARGRIRRIGQTRPQFYNYLQCDKTIEEDVSKVLKTKSDFSSANWLASMGLDKEGRLA